ncbi:MAG: dipeptidase [Bacillota bacterium]|jgi:membrane dipeptidase|nr:membrane dipeptidase [Candidatus Fermentithermobacillaceae bacterium]
MDIASIFKKKGENGPAMEEIRMERAEELHSENLVIDGHQGTLLDVIKGVRKFGEESSMGHSDLPRLRQAGVDCVILSAFPHERLYPIRGVRQALDYIDAFLGLASAPGVRHVFHTSDIEDAQEADEAGIMLSLGDGAMLEGSLETLRMYHKLGVRMLTLTWNDRNLLGDGAAFSASRGGLTPFGIRVVEEAAKLGMVVDVSHLSEAGFWDVLDVAQAPFVASHVNCHVLLPHPRNLTDAQLKAIGEAGGLVGISFNHEYITGTDEQATISQVADHIIHAMEVAGEDNVGLGTDFDSFGEPGPEPVTHIGKLPLLTFELLKRGISGQQIAGILGRNWMRVLRAVIG